MRRMLQWAISSQDPKSQDMGKVQRLWPYQPVPSKRRGNRGHLSTSGGDEDIVCSRVKTWAGVIAHRDSVANYLDKKPKRIMFINTQHSHTVGSSAYRQSPIRTGYEAVVGKRTGKMFSAAAREDGKVIELTEKGLIVEYANGEKEGVELGRLYGKAEGSIYPHDLVPHVKLGQKVSKGDILAYNQKFFEPDFRNPKDVVLKIGVMDTVAFLEEPSTHEDSSTISRDLSRTLITETTKVKSYIVNFTQNLRNIKAPGEEVEPRDVLMIIEDDITATHGQFSDDSVSVLKRLSNISPRAGVLGVVDKIEIFYHGDKRDMSPTLRKLADRSDQELAKAAKSKGAHVITGRVTDEYRVAGTPLELNKAEVRIYITTKAPTGVGDKVIFGHQMKSTIAEVVDGEIRTEDGTKVNATFSYRSVAARGVHSAALMGTTAVLLELIANRAVKLYKEGKL